MLRFIFLALFELVLIGRWLWRSNKLDVPCGLGISLPLILNLSCWNILVHHILNQFLSVLYPLRHRYCHFIRVQAHIIIHRRINSRRLAVSLLQFNSLLAVSLLKVNYSRVIQIQTTSQLRYFLLVLWNQHPLVFLEHRQLVLVKIHYVVLVLHLNVVHLLVFPCFAKLFVLSR